MHHAQQTTKTIPLTLTFNSNVWRLLSFCAGSYIFSTQPFDTLYYNKDTHTLTQWEILKEMNLQVLKVYLQYMLMFVFPNITAFGEINVFRKHIYFKLIILEEQKIKLTITFTRWNVTYTCWCITTPQTFNTISGVYRTATLLSNKMSDAVFHTPLSNINCITIKLNITMINNTYISA